MHQRRRVVSLIAASPLVGLAGITPTLAAPASITLLHSNDVYQIAPVKGQGGFAPFMTLLRAERARNANTITSFGGDLLSPSILSGLSKGAQMIELTNALGVEVAVLGNHEFDFGPAVAEERVRASRYPWLGSNVLTPGGEPAVGTVDLWLKEVDGYRIGFFGLLTPETATLSQPGPNIRFAPPLAIAEAAVKHLEEMGADLVVALTHQDLADDRALAANVDGIDIVLGGHDHDPITIFEGGKLIVKAGYDLHYLAAIDLTLERVMDKDREVVVWHPAWRYLPTAGVAPDPEIQAIVERWNTTLDQELAEPVGRTTRRARHPPQHGAHGRIQFRRPAHRRPAQCHRRGRGLEQWRRHQGRSDLSGRHGPDPQGHPDRAAVRQRHRPGRGHRRRPAGCAREWRLPGRGRCRAVPAGLGPELHLRPDPARRVADRRGRRSAARHSTRREPTSSPPTTICSAAATAMPACGRPRRSSTPRPARSWPRP